MNNQPNSLGRAIYNTQDNSKLDAAVKQLLSQKPILAYILKYAVKEFSAFSIDDIIPMIDKVHVAQVPVEPGSTNDMITGEPQESKIPGEGTITYDVRFTATLPGGDKPSEYNLMIDVEAQANQELPYDVETRAVVYGGRLISEQIGRNVTHSHYENIQKVYTIWICMNCIQEEANTISEYGIAQVDHVGEIEREPRVDILRAIIIRLPKDDAWDKAKHPATNLTEMLATLLSNRIAPDEKISALENKYGIKATEAIREEVNKMCDYSTAIANEAETRGKVLGAIDMLKDDGVSEEEIVKRVAKKYSVSEDYVRNLMHTAA